jgi:hypothetical protein
VGVVRVSAHLIDKARTPPNKGAACKPRLEGRDREQNGGNIGEGISSRVVGTKARDCNCLEVQLVYSVEICSVMASTCTCLPITLRLDGRRALAYMNETVMFRQN